MTPKSASQKLSRYPGLTPFSTEQKEIFFGREIDSVALYNLVIRENITLLYAKSGLGKSSLINAGLIPLLEKRTDIHPIFVRFGAYQVGKSLSLKDTILQALPQVEPLTYLDKITPNQNSIWYQLKKITLQRIENISYLLIFDQFEEIFTYPKAEIIQFKTELADALYKEMPDDVWERYEGLIATNDLNLSDEVLDKLEENIPVKLLFSLREDKYSLLNQITDALPDTGQHRYTLKALNIHQAKEAILKPAQQKGHFFSDTFEYTQEALDKIISFLSKSNNHVIEATQLQILCDRIELDVRKQGKTLIGINDIPEFKNILNDFYKKTLEVIPKEELDETRKFIEDELIQQGLRMSIAKEMRPKGLSETTLDKLVNLHLLRSEINTVGLLSYELTHDTLVEPILEEKKRRDEKTKKVAEEKARQEAEQRIRQETEAKFQKRKRISILVILSLVVLSIIGIGYTSQLESKRLELENLNNELREQKDALQTQKKALKDTTEKLLDARVELNDKIATLNLSKEDKQKLDSTLNSTEGLVEKRENSIETLNKRITRLEKERNELKQGLDNLQKQLIQKDTTIKKLEIKVDFWKEKYYND